MISLDNVIKILTARGANMTSPAYVNENKIETENTIIQKIRCSFTGVLFSINDSQQKYLKLKSKNIQFGKQNK